MTPEEIVRNRAWDPHYDNPDPDAYLDASPPRDHGALERRLAVIFVALALIVFGFIVGKTLP
jgi:hypothetical protein